MASAGAEVALSPLLICGDNALSHTARFLTGKEGAALMATCRHVRDVLDTVSTWEQYMEADLPYVGLGSKVKAVEDIPFLPEGAPPPPPAPRPAPRNRAAVLAARDAYAAKLAMAAVRRVRWCKPSPPTDALGEREGTAAAGVFGRLVVCGGFCSGFPTLDNSLWWAESTTTTDLEWRQAVVSGTPCSPRYGHSLTTVVVDGRPAMVVFGGHHQGSYMGEIATLHLLKPALVPNPALGEAATAGAGADGAPPPGAEPEQVLSFEWSQPALTGDPLDPRGYHSATFSSHDNSLYVFGGIAGGDSIASLQRVNLHTWEVSTVVAVAGDPPPPRYGNGLVSIGSRLWVVGGSNGGNLLREGEELPTVYSFDLETSAWAYHEVATHPEWLGRCLSAVAVGPNIVVFGGSADLSNEVAVWSTEACTWRGVREEAEPGATRPEPCFNTTHVLLGGVLYMFGGWAHGPLGHTLRLQLDVKGDAELAPPPAEYVPQPRRGGGSGGIPMNFLQLLLRMGVVNPAAMFGGGGAYDDDGDDDDEEYLPSDDD